MDIPGPMDMDLWVAKGRGMGQIDRERELLGHPAVHGTKHSQHKVEAFTMYG